MSRARGNTSPSRPSKDIADTLSAHSNVARITSRSKLSTNVQTVASIEDEHIEQTRAAATRANYQLVAEKQLSSEPYVVNISVYDNNDSKTAANYAFRVILVGSSGVGKTSIIQRIFDTTAASRFEPAASQCFSEWHLAVTMSDGSVIHLTLCDTAGEERYASIMSTYYRGAQGCLVIYDITAHESYEKMAKHIEQVQRFATNPYIMLIGNKKDLESCRVVPTSDALEFAEKYRFFLCETSAQTGVGIDTAFHRFIAALYNKRTRGPISPRQEYRNTLTMSGTIVLKAVTPPLDAPTENEKAQSKCSSC